MHFPRMNYLKLSCFTTAGCCCDLSASKKGRKKKFDILSETRFLLSGSLEEKCLCSHCCLMKLFRPCVVTLLRGLVSKFTCML